MSQGRRWTVTDARGNPIYVTEERWEHIRRRHPDLAAREDAVRDTIRKGRRHQDALKLAKYFYRYAVEGLPEEPHTSLRLCSLVGKRPLAVRLR